MRSLLKFILSLAVAFLLMLAFRALAFTIYSVDGEGLEPDFINGDRVMVNRWSYGLRTGGNRLFSYGRLCRQPMQRGDIVAYDDPTDSLNRRVLFGRLTAIPGDTIRYEGHLELVPGLVNCTDVNYYWIQSLNEENQLDSRQFGYVSEKAIIGRAFLVVYSHMSDSSMWRGYRNDRFLLLK